MFIADASASREDPSLKLPAKSAVIWAAAEKQPKHRSFVLAQHIPCGSPMTKGDLTASSELDTVHELLDNLVNR